MYGAAQSSGPLADSLEVAAATNEDKDGDGFRDEDPSQPWPLYVIAAVVAGVAIFVTYKLVGPALRRRE